jgi:hypothetical protein
LEVLRERQLKLLLEFQIDPNTQNFNLRDLGASNREEKDLEERIKGLKDSLKLNNNILAKELDRLTDDYIRIQYKLTQNDDPFRKAVLIVELA